MTCEKENGSEFDGEMRPSPSTSFLAVASLVAPNEPPLLSYVFFFTNAMYIINKLKWM